jgi:hypothetical protein
MADDVRARLMALKPAASAVWRLAGSVALAYLFVLLLITASLQTSVSDRLAKLQPPLDYSTGYALWLQDQTNGRALKLLRGREDEFNKQIDQADDQKQEALDTWQTSIDSGSLLLRRLSAVPGCATTAEPQGPRTEQVLSDLRACLDQGALNPSQRQAIEDELGKAAAFRESDRKFRLQENAVERLKTQLDRTKIGIANLSNRDQERTKATGALTELATFMGGRIFGGDVVGAFPPPIVQILLAFVSGMFGTLLITLVLVVYPNSDLKLSTGGGGYEARIFLGGLISICVFVVLGGGTAVLGTSRGFGDGEANFLAFTAIGILAGMFSDRVAQWLSGRADSFFSRDRGDEAEGSDTDTAGAGPRPQTNGAGAPAPAPDADAGNVAPAG